MGTRRVDRVAVIVCDGLGVGATPDAEAYGDAGSNTLGHLARAVGGVRLPNLEALGIGCLTDVEGVGDRAAPGTAHGRLGEASAGKDSTTGHWEMAGLVTRRAFPTYPDGFPPEVIGLFERAIGRPVLGNEVASGTEIIERLGEEHVRTGRPIVYTSADSVFQVACHVDVVPLETLYEWCGSARGILKGDHAVGRVIARPFRGEAGSFVRTPDRRDYSVPPPGPTVLDFALRAGVDVYGVGKIRDIFDGHGLTQWRYSDSNDHGIDLTLEYLGRAAPSLVVTNLVDFDSKYGHRNDPQGYASCLEALDRRVPEVLAAAGAPGSGGLVFVTGDHGCDPTDVSTDHTREYTPMLAAGIPLDRAVDVGTRATFADLGATVAEVLGIPTEGLAGEGFAAALGW
jgi:phosphopentomutase